ncbi:hypothetical protein CMQ_2267 [Grosmannia clavigera kw1407]|uniref:Uncharacterized protein n=1 Tax=Grosmannia clavigera (strain kw1407 / UAMH 11150) TaxID=655863 RepID=F0XJ83_GROCL|nr:uncharacterized protein CMQ_2267 [Grosmannia clavigera kw1407]EFX02218.1 hypothetical protein CMQ_2267 [Grosmannia clavigera kw1407]
MPEMSILRSLSRADLAGPPVRMPRPLLLGRGPDGTHADSDQQREPGASWIVDRLVEPSSGGSQLCLTRTRSWPFVSSLPTRCCCLHIDRDSFALIGFTLSIRPLSLCLSLSRPPLQIGRLSCPDSSSYCLPIDRSPGCATGLNLVHPSPQLLFFSPTPQPQLVVPAADRSPTISRRPAAFLHERQNQILGRRHESKLWASLGFGSDRSAVSPQLLQPDAAVTYKN